MVCAHRSCHVRVLGIPGDMSAGRWWGYFPDVVVVLEGDTQMSALADMIQAALMLKYNTRKVG